RICLGKWEPCSVDDRHCCSGRALPVVSQSDMYRTDAEGVSERTGAAMQTDSRQAGGITGHFDLGPTWPHEAEAPKRFQHRLLGSKPSCDVAGGLVAGEGVCDFVWAEPPIEESTSTTFGQCGEACDGHQISTDTEHLHRSVRE